MPAKTFFIHTIGCQMNVHDAELMAQELAVRGYVPALAPEEADLVVVNTCSVRDKAEQKAFSLIGRLENLRQQRPAMVLAVAGCVAQQEGPRLWERAPQVDIVLGTGAVRRLGLALERVEAGRERVADLEPAAAAEDFTAAARPGAKVARYLTIMRGCDNFCSYCVVPHVRGPETSRPPEAILGEARALVAAGVREVTLLGQNVNSYGRKENLCRFAELLAMLNAVEGLLRIRFTTSHPKDLTGDLVEAFAGLEKLCAHIHLPVQSGSDPILARMNRGYTRAQYLEKVAALRAACPEIAITSDMIVGFPGETDSDFEETLDLVRQVQFDGIFAFMYSDRPQAPARSFGGKVPFAVKRERLQRLLALQEGFTFAKNRAMVGSVQDVLTEGPGRSRGPAATGPAGPAPLTGRTAGNKIVHFQAGEGPGRPRGPAKGQMARVRIERALAHSLWGSLESHRPAEPAGKGDG
jgi:tRNA-2-methylthio-N6-dimethylallyladenosine synthase